MIHHLKTLFLVSLSLYCFYKAGIRLCSFTPDLYHSRLMLMGQCDPTSAPSPSACLNREQEVQPSPPHSSGASTSVYICNSGRHAGYKRATPNRTPVRVTLRLRASGNWERPSPTWAVQILAWPAFLPCETRQRCYNKQERVCFMLISQVKPHPK